MSYPEIKKILLRLYNSYVKKYLGKLILSLFLSLLVAGSTGAIAWLLDPAIKKIFVDQDKTMMLFGDGKQMMTELASSLKDL